MDIPISDRALRMMKMTEDPTQWDEMVKELKRYRKVDPYCLDVLATCYRVGMGVYCDHNKANGYFMLAGTLGCDYRIGPYERRYRILRYWADRTHLKYFSHVIQTKDRTFEEKLALESYGVDLMAFALNCMILHIEEGYEEFRMRCMPFGFHGCYLTPTEGPYHSVDYAQRLISYRYNFPDSLRFEHVVPLKCEFQGCGQFFTGVEGCYMEAMEKGIRFRTLKIHDLVHWMKNQRFKASLRHTSQWIEHISFTFLCVRNKNSDVIDAIEFHALFPNLKKMTVQSHGPAELDYLIPLMGPKLNRLKLNTTKHSSLEFRRLVAGNHNLRVNDMAIDIPLLVLVNFSLCSLFPPWYPSQLRDLVLSQVWAQRKFELLSQ